MRPIPFQDEQGNRVDVNDTINDVLTIDTTKPSQSLPYDNGSGQIHNRDFFSPTDSTVTVYGFGFLFQPKEDGLHETHMNQGNPIGNHNQDNGVWQDGALFVNLPSQNTWIAVFIAFQTQVWTTDNNGNQMASGAAVRASPGDRNLPLRREETPISTQPSTTLP